MANDNISVLPYSSDIIDHLRSLKRVHFIKQLTRDKVRIIHDFRKRYNINYNWKEDIRNRFEAIIANEKTIHNHLNKDVKDFIAHPEVYRLYKAIRSKSKNIIPAKDILLLQHIAIEHYIDYGTGLNKRSEEDCARDKLMVDNIDFIDSLNALGDKLGIKYSYEGLEKPGSAVRWACKEISRAKPAIITYVFNTEPPLLQVDINAYYKIIRKGAIHILYDGIYMPFERLKGLKKNAFIDLCEVIYNKNRTIFEPYHMMSAEKITDNINIHLIRDVDQVSTKDICDLFARAYDNDYFSSSTVKSEVQRVRDLFHIPSLRSN